MRAAPILILGMHRSGTSCLAGCLEEAGLYLGDVNTKAQFNAKGNRENFTVMAVHDEVLASAAGNWDNPPASQPCWDDAALARLESVISSYPTDKIWGLKDPRLLFVMDGWRKLTDPQLVGTFRHPAEVAKSLLRRAESWNRPMDEAHAYDLWARYNRRMLEERARTAFPIIKYPDRDYISKVAGICKSFGLAPPAAFTFFDSELRHYDAVSAEIPGELREIWTELNDVAV